MSVEAIVSCEGEAGFSRSVVPRVPIGPLRVSLVSARDLTRRLLGQASGSVTQHVVTANAQFYVLAEENPAFRLCLSGADYVCADGISIVMACQWLGRTQVARIPGVDLMSDLCEGAAAAGLPVFFLGGNPGSAARCAARLSALFPGLQVAGIQCPPRGFERREFELASVLRQVEMSRPAILFVALGAPAQELFIQTHIRPLGVPVAIGVGGSFEIIGGDLRRAPQWLQKLGLEWAFRLAQEPRRLARRYIVGNALFLYYLARHLFGSREQA